MSKLQLILNFEDVDDLKAYIEDYEAIHLNKIKKLFKKNNDKRGSSTKTLHIKAKEYQKENPSSTYKQALQAVGNQIREEKKKFISVYDTTERLINENEEKN